MTTAANVERLLVVNADDFGFSQGVNAGIVRAHEQGIVTSTSLMVRQPGAAGAGEYARANSRLGVGLHIDIGEWVFADGAWTRRYAFVDDPSNAAALEREVDGQLQAFVGLVGRPPTHIDSHQHVHRSEPLRSIVQNRAASLRIPARWLSPGIRHCGGFYGQDGRGQPYPYGISAANLTRLISGLSPGITEISCHPGEAIDITSSYAQERQLEVATLCAPDLRTVIDRAGIRLVTFGELGRFL